MPSPGRLATTLLLGTGLGAGPYGVAVMSGGIPTKKEITEEKEESKFGEICLLDEEMCEVMKDQTAWTSAEAEQGKDQVDSSKPWEKLPESLLKERWDDVCVWGFHDETLNTLANCKPEEKTSTGTSTEGGAITPAAPPAQPSAKDR